VVGMASHMERPGLHAEQASAQIHVDIAGKLGKIKRRYFDFE
jgi:hypothetical protein